MTIILLGMTYRAAVNQTEISFNDPCIISVLNAQKWINVDKDSKTKSINSNWRIAGYFGLLLQQISVVYTYDPGTSVSGVGKKEIENPLLILQPNVKSLCK